MNLREQLAVAMPALLRHEGTWCGTYRHIDAGGGLVDEHRSHVQCEFPETGPWAYVQTNRFEWADGRRHEVSFGGVLKGDRLYWDTPQFRGYGWCARDVVLLELERLDEPGVRFVEAIILGDTRRRARTWHWFREGELIRRTLCDERRQD